MKRYDGEFFMEPHELDKLNRIHEEDDPMGGAVLITCGFFAFAGMVIGGLIVYLVMA